jgi:hypothetical protein
MIDMLKRHEVQVLRRAGHTWKEIVALSGVSVRTVRRITAETDITTIDNGAERARRQVGRRRRPTSIRTCWWRRSRRGRRCGRSNCSIAPGRQGTPAARARSTRSRRRCGFGLWRRWCDSKAARARLRHRGAIAYLLGQTGPREDARGDRGRVSGDSEWLRCVLHDGRDADR